MFILHYARHHAGYTETYHTLEGALKDAANWLEYDLIWPKMITDDTGRVIYDQDALLRAIGAGMVEDEVK